MKYLNNFLSIIILSLAISGCVSSSPYVVHNQYLLNMKTFASQPKQDYKYTVMINPVSVVPPFNQANFMYRTNDFQYLTDYYHGFAVPLAQQSDAFLLNYCYAIGKFQSLTIYGEFNQQAYKLQPMITQFYADYRERNHPSAIVALNLKLYRFENNKASMVMNRTFTARVPIKVKDTENLLIAWQDGLQTVMLQGIGELNKFLEK
jgi:uncharacterized lipoprotein YmbA